MVTTGYKRLLSITAILAISLGLGGAAGAEQVASGAHQRSADRAKPRAVTRPAPGPMRPPVPRTVTPWQKTAVVHRGHNRRRVRVYCPGGGPLAAVWGTSTYTDDSSVCSAAVHSGVITMARGGRVTIQIRRGARAYRGTRSNGVTSQAYGVWTGSFVVLSAVPGPVPSTNNNSGARSIGWRDTATKLRGRIGSKRMFHCPPSTGLGAIWGDGLYTDDSSICTAAVHAGTISVRAGGTVIIQIARGAPSYAGSLSNGVRSARWGRWSGSFVVVGGSFATPPVHVGPAILRWTDSATSYRGRNGTQLTFACPAGGRPATVWGSSIYTDDSSICTAAVHDGRITLRGGGEVTIEIRRGEPKYAGRTRNGTTTRPYGQWTGSYVFVP